MLDAASLEAITLEARQCFLTEDAPDYLLLLHQGIESLTQAKKEKLTPAASIYQNLIRVAHSLKGGAGIAQLPQLQQLAHRLEDLLQAMAGGKIADLTLAIELITLSLESINQLIEVAKNGQEETIVNSRELIETLGEFLSSIEKAKGEYQVKKQQEFSKKILLTDLEECIKQLEKTVNSDKKILKQNLQTFSEECLLLGETLKIEWLREIGEIGVKGIKLGIDLEKLARAIILEVRELRKQFLADNLGNKELKLSPRLTQLIPQESHSTLNTIEPTQIGEPNLVQEYLQVELSLNNSQQNTFNLAIPLENVEEVITKKKSEICPIPEVDSTIYGVINYRGKLLWVLGLADLLKLNQTPEYIQPHRKMSLVVIKRETQKICCFVSSLKEIVFLNEQQFSLTNITSENKYLKVETQDMAILDVNAVFNFL